MSGALKIGAGLLGVLLLLALFMPSLEISRGEARRIQARHCLKQLGLALRLYGDAFGRLPPGGIVSEKRRGMHGWPTLLAPYVGDDDGRRAGREWSDSIDLGIPWDDVAQLERFAVFPAKEVFRDYNVSPHGTGGTPLAHFAANSWLMHRNFGASPQDVTDASGTLLLADAGAPYDGIGSPWNWREVGVIRDSGPDSFGTGGRPSTHVLTMAGDVKTIARSVDDRVWLTYRGPSTLRPDPADVQRSSDPPDTPGSRPGPDSNPSQAGAASPPIE